MKNYISPYFTALSIAEEDVITTSLTGADAGSEVLIDFDDFIKKGQSK